MCDLYVCTLEKLCVFYCGLRRVVFNTIYISALNSKKCLCRLFGFKFIYLCLKPEPRVDCRAVRSLVTIAWIETRFIHLIIHWKRSCTLYITSLHFIPLRAAERYKYSNLRKSARERSCSFVMWFGVDRLQSSVLTRTTNPGYLSGSARPSVYLEFVRPYACLSVCLSIHSLIKFPHS